MNIACFVAPAQMRKVLHQPRRNLIPQPLTVTLYLHLFSSFKLIPPPSLSQSIFFSPAFLCHLSVVFYRLINNLSFALPDWRLLSTMEWNNIGKNNSNNNDNICSGCVLKQECREGGKGERKIGAETFDALQQKCKWNGPVGHMGESRHSGTVWDYRG